MAGLRVEHPSVEDRQARGKGSREQTPRASHAGWEPAPDRADPVALLDEQNQTRDVDLVPVRHGRMLASAFTFYRGAAKIMAADLKATPRAGLTTQLCGDAHLSNFGVFASPERALLFDLNDFDETLPGPFEYDVKRMSASFTIAARNNGFTKAEQRDVTLASVRAYREAMAEFAQMRTMDIWYAADPSMSCWRLLTLRRAARRTSHSERWPRCRQGRRKGELKARTRDSCRRRPSSRSTSTGTNGS